MRKTNLTREEISLLINGVQRTLIKLEHHDPSSELVRKHRLLIKTLLDMEKELLDKPGNEPITSYK